MMRKIVLCLMIMLSFTSLIYAQQENRPDSWAHRISNAEFSNLYLITDDLLRSEQPSEKGFKSLRQQGVKSILNLRSSHGNEKLTKNFQLYRIKMIPEKITEKQLMEALRIIKNADKPILIHCARGADRTGAVVAMYRIVFEGWEKEKALKEMIEGGYRFHEGYRNIPKLIENTNVERLRKKLGVEKNKSLR